MEEYKLSSFHLCQFYLDRYFFKKEKPEYEKLKSDLLNYDHVFLMEFSQLVLPAFCEKKGEKPKSCVDPEPKHKNYSLFKMKLLEEEKSKIQKLVNILSDLTLKMTSLNLCHECLNLYFFKEESEKPDYYGLEENLKKQNVCFLTEFSDMVIQVFYEQKCGKPPKSFTYSEPKHEKYILLKKKLHSVGKEKIIKLIDIVGKSLIHASS